MHRQQRPLLPEISAAIASATCVVCSVLSGNRNFEGRIQQDVRANYLASPPLVVAYALAGTMNVDLTTGAARHRQETGTRCSCATSGRPSAEIQETMLESVHRGDVREQFRTFSTATRGGAARRCRPATASRGSRTRRTSGVRRSSTSLSVQPSPLEEIAGARACRVLGDSITTDHISPAGSIKADSPAGNT